MNDTQTKPLDQIIQDLEISIERHPIDAPQSAPSWTDNMDAYRVTLRYDGRQFSLNFYQGKGHKDHPTAAQVIECLASDLNCIESCDSLADFRAEFGDETSPAIYHATKRIAGRYKKLIGNQEILDLIWEGINA